MVEIGGVEIQHRRGVQRGHLDVGGVGGDREGRRTAARPRIDLGASRARGLVPGPEHDGIRHRAEEAGGRLEIQVGVGVGGKQQRRSARHRADSIPVRSAVGRVEPCAMAGVGGGQRDAGNRVVGVGDVVEAAGRRIEIDQARHQGAGRDPRIRRREVLGDGVEHRCLRGVQDRRIVDRNHMHGRGDRQRGGIVTAIGDAAIVLDRGERHHPVGCARVLAAVAIAQRVDQRRHRGGRDAPGLRHRHGRGGSGQRDQRRHAVGRGGDRIAVGEGHVAAVDAQDLGGAVRHIGDTELKLDDRLPALDGRIAGAGEQCNRSAVLGVGRVGPGRRSASAHR